MPDVKSWKNENYALIDGVSWNILFKYLYLKNYSK